MKRIASISLAAITVTLLAACGNERGDRSADAQRHQRTALTYQQQGQFRPAMLEARNAVQLQPREPAGYIVLAQIYNRVGAYASTQGILEPIVEELPEVSTELAEAYLATKKFRSALNLLSNSKGREGDELRRLSIQARAHTELGDKAGFDRSIQALQDIENSAAEIQYLQANYAMSQGRGDEAVGILEASLAQHPQHLKTLILLGQLSLYANNLTKAENYLTQALSQSPSGDVMTVDRATILGSLTQTLIQQGRTSEAYTYQKLLADANPEGQVVQQKFADAMELYQQGKFAEAEVLLKEIHAQFPNDRNAGTLLGLVQYQQGDDQQALDLFDQFLDPETANPSIIQAAAVAKYRTNNVDDAVALLKTAAENQPNDATILATYGLALLDRDGTSNEGALALEKSLALNPAQQRLRIALAKRHVAMDKKEQALAQLQKAYREQPQDLIIQQSYFKMLIDEGMADTVQDEIRDFQQQYPGNPRGQFMDGWLKVEQKNYRAAQASFEKALSMPNNTERAMAYSGLAHAFERDNQPQKAVTAWEGALREDPSMVSAYRRWLNIMRSLNRGQEAITFLNDLEQKKVDAWQPSVVLAQLFFSQRQTEQAIKHIDVARQRSSDSTMVRGIAADLYNQRGLELRAQQDLPAARASFLKALEFYPDNIAYLANLIDIELSQKNISEAQQLLDQFEQSDATAAAHLFLQGAIYRSDDEQEAALKAFRQSWDVQPSDNAAEAIYAHYQQANNSRQAAQMVDQWIEKLPQSSRPTLIKAMEAQQNNSSKEAIKWYERTVELAPRNPAALNNLAWIYYEQKDSRALEFAKRAYEAAPNSPPILDTYGWVLVETGQVAEGLKYLERAAAMAPDSEDIQQHLREAKARAQ